MTITVETVGRRVYIKGHTFHLRDQIRAIGGHWDPDARAWWVGSGKREEAERLASSAADAPTEEQADPLARLVGARASYKGKPCYIAAHSRDDGAGYAVLVATRDYSRYLCVSMDGARQWWGAAAELQITKHYRAPITIGELKEYAQARRNGEPDRSYSAYLAEIEAAEDMDCFAEASALRRMGYHAWRAQGGAA